MATFSRHETTEMDDRSDTFTKVEKALTTFRNAKACKRFVGSCVSEGLPVETIRAISDHFQIQPSWPRGARPASLPGWLSQVGWR